MRFSEVHVSLLALIVGVLSAGSLLAQDDRYTFRVGQEVGTVDSVVLVDVHLDAVVGSGGQLPTPMESWRFGVCHDPTMLEIELVESGSVTFLDPPDFHGMDWSSGTGFLVNVIYTAHSPSALPPGPNLHVNRVHYLVTAPEAGVSPLSFCDSLTTPSSPPRLGTEGMFLDPVVVDGAVTILPSRPFLRGLCNADSVFDIADVVFLFNYLFPAGDDASLPSCDDACDANDDGQLTIADGVAMIDALFGAPPMPLPGPSSCGIDLTPDGIGCAQISACP